MGFSRQEHWSGLPFPSLGDLPDPGVKPGSSALQADSLPSEPPGKPSGRFKDERTVLNSDLSLHYHVFYNKNFVSIKKNQIFSNCCTGLYFSFFPCFVMLQFTSFTLSSTPHQYRVSLWSTGRHQLHFFSSWHYVFLQRVSIPHDWVLSSHLCAHPINVGVSSRGLNYKQ